MIAPSVLSCRPILRARAALRLGLAGGGTDLSPYCDRFGGAVLNATIDRFVEATLGVPASSQVRFVDETTHEVWEGPPERALEGGGRGLALHRAVYRRCVTEFQGGRPFPIEIATASEAPLGSGLGASSTLVVAMVAAFVELWRLGIGRQAIARLAYEIERCDAKLPGGRQDHYAAAYGGVNFLEFHANEHVVVTPIAVAPTIVARLEQSLLLLHTGIARDSTAIIIEQQRRVSDGGADDALGAMHRLKANAIRMRASLARGDFDDFHAAINESWASKKQTAPGISNGVIESIHTAAMAAGASAAKVSGAGGGGFVVMFVEPSRRDHVIRALGPFEGRVEPCRFAAGGAQVRREP
ncbi:MAG TPA: hypothetical protein VMZ90_13955 [Vicinamibacterales bacterium]|nr:hypothetical protein [Vicinamibacterales bacterium]